jgi:hypothetical protein
MDDLKQTKHTPVTHPHHHHHHHPVCLSLYMCLCYYNSPKEEHSSSASLGRHWKYHHYCRLGLPRLCCQTERTGGTRPVFVGKTCRHSRRARGTRTGISSTIATTSSPVTSRSRSVTIATTTTIEKVIKKGERKEEKEGEKSGRGFLIERALDCGKVEVR